MEDVVKSHLITALGTWILHNEEFAYWLFLLCVNNVHIITIHPCMHVNKL
jgi:hypothetical protein